MSTTKRVNFLLPYAYAASESSGGFLKSGFILAKLIFVCPVLETLSPKALLTIEYQEVGNTPVRVFHKIFFPKWLE